MRLLLVLHDATLAGELGHELAVRRDEVEVWPADSFDEARRWLEDSPFDAVLVSPGKKRLGFEHFLSRMAQATPRPRVLLLGEEAPGTQRIEPGSAAKIVAQLFSSLGHTRSALADARVIEVLGYSGPARLERVEWPGADRPVLRAALEAGTFQPEGLPRAMRLGALHGPGLAPTLECFWDDASPHLLQAIPPGIALHRLMVQRKAEGVDAALAIVRGVAEGVRTAHAAGVSAGYLDPSSIWLGADGSVTLLAVPLGQVASPRERFYGLPREAPPEEFGTSLAPQVEGDAYRLGVLLMRLAVDDDPVSALRPFEHVAARWEPDLGPHRAALGRAGELIEILAQAQGGDRPRGELLFDLVARQAPARWAELVAAAVAWSATQPWYVSM